MGRRAKKAPVVTKRRPKLAKRFKCPFCANEDTVECKMDMKAMLGSLRCRLCAAAYQMPINHLHEPIDVFSEWLDDCEAAQNPTTVDAALGTAGARYDDLDDDNEDDDDDDLLHGSGSGGGGGKKKAAVSTLSTSKKPSATTAANTYEDLGLGDSEDDDDDDVE